MKSLELILFQPVFFTRFLFQTFFKTFVLKILIYQPYNYPILTCHLNYHHLFVIITFFEPILSVRFRQLKQ